jgi:hypothetical protein
MHVLLAFASEIQDQHLFTCAKKLVGTLHLCALKHHGYLTNYCFLPKIIRLCPDKFFEVEDFVLVALELYSHCLAMILQR